MRSFPTIIIIIDLLIYILISWGGLVAIRNLFSASQKKLKKRISVTWLLYSFIILFLFIYLFIYPQNASSAKGYASYFVFNIVLITDIFVKLILTITLIAYYFLRIFGLKKISILISGMIISSGIILSVIFGSVFGKNHLTINSVDIAFNDLPPSFDGYKIVQLSDIHIGSFNKDKRLLEKTIDKISGLNPDLLLFTGDLVNNFDYETTGWKENFQRLKAKHGKFSILGNHDYGDYFKWEKPTDKEENFNNILISHKEFDFTLLRNRSVPIINSLDTIFLLGVENWGHSPFPQYADLDNAMRNVPNKSFKILMTHDPSHWESNIAGKNNINLTLSGHTHGMQWGLKPAGIEFSLMYFVRKNWAGLYNFNDQYLYVNRGLGTIGLNLRLEMPAEITLITLIKK